MAFFKKEKNLFGDNISPKCEYCSLGSLASDGEMILCSKKGVVTSDFSCKKFSYMPAKRKPKRRKAMETYSAEDFKL